MTKPDSKADDNCFAGVLACRDDFLREAANRLLAQPRIAMAGLVPSNVPKEPGVYAFYKFDIEKPFHIGESSNLRQRIYTNQLNGKISQSRVKKKLKDLYGDELPDTELTSFIREFFSVQFFELSLGRKEVEDYLVAKFKDAESRPHGKAK